MSAVASEVSRHLHSARRRFAGQVLLAQTGRALIIAGAVLVLALGAERWAGLPMFRPGLLWALAAGVVVYPCVMLGFRWPPLGTVAELLDRRGGTHDRLTTALAFAEEPASPMHELARRECREYLQRQDFRRLLPWRIGPAWRWLAVPLVTAALLRWDLSLQQKQEAARVAAGQQEVAPTVEALRALAKELAANAKKANDPALQKLAEEMARRTEKLQAAAKDRAAAEKARLGELSSLEQLAQELRQAAESKLTPEEQKAIAEALQKAEASRPAGEKMQQGDLAKAADELERAAKKAASGKDPSAAEAEKSLKEALDRMAQQKQLSQNAQRQLSAGQGSALQKLAELLRQLPPSQGGGKPGKNTPGNQQALQNLLAALQNMKAGQGSAGQGGKPAPQNGNSPQIVQISPAQPSGQNSPGNAQFSMPSGNPGTEHDTGTTDTPFGERQEAAHKGGEFALQGQQSEEGETASQYLPSAQDGSRASRRYKQMYDQMAPAVENAVLQEEIPLGSRLFIKRYFESIRPQE